MLLTRKRFSQAATPPALEIGHFEDYFHALARIVPMGPQDLSPGLGMRIAQCRYLPGKGAPEGTGPETGVRPGVKPRESAQTPHPRPGGAADVTGRVQTSRP